MSRAKRRVVIISAAMFLALSLGAGGSVFVLWQKRIADSPVISKEILAEANFTIFYPQDITENAAAWKFQKDRTSYNKESGVLTLQVVQPSTGRRIILNEQPTPGAFADVPTQYSKMLTALNEYNELQIGFGTVALTHPKELNGGQAAVANKSGTLIFAKPSANLTDEEWRNFFENLRILR